MTHLRVARVMHGTTAEGPGLRTAIWVQGCTIRCAGCINPHLFSSRGGYLVDPADVVDEALQHCVEGITLLGGEPMEQPEAGLALASHARERGLGVICFTGFNLEALTSTEQLEFLAQIDMLVDGPYVADEPEPTRALVGSSNQRFHHLTDRYRDYDPSKSRNRVELRLNPNGTIDGAGFLKTEEVRSLAMELGARRTPGRHS